MNRFVSKIEFVLNKLRRNLAKSVFGGEVREATDEESAVGVANELGIAGGVICKI